MNFRLESKFPGFSGFLCSLNVPFLLCLSSSGAARELHFCFRVCLLLYCQSECSAIGCRSVHSKRMWAKLSLWNINICMLCVPSARPPRPEGGVEEGEGGGKSFLSEWLRNWISLKSGKRLSPGGVWGEVERPPLRAAMAFLHCTSLLWKCDAFLSSAFAVCRVYFILIVPCSLLASFCSEPKVPRLLAALVDLTAFSKCLTGGTRSSPESLGA